MNLGKLEVHVSRRRDEHTFTLADVDRRLGKLVPTGHMEGLQLWRGNIGSPLFAVARLARRGEVAIEQNIDLLQRVACGCAYNMLLDHSVLWIHRRENCLVWVDDAGWLVLVVVCDALSGAMKHALCAWWQSSTFYQLAYINSNFRHCSQPGPRPDHPAHVPYTSPRHGGTVCLPCPWAAARDFER